MLAFDKTPQLASLVNRHNRSTVRRDESGIIEACVSLVRNHGNSNQILLEYFYLRDFYAA